MNEKDLIAIREAELARLRRQVRLQQRTMETMRDALERNGDRPRVVTIGPRLGTAEGKHASPPCPKSWRRRGGRRLGYQNRGSRQRRAWPPFRSPVARPQ